MTETQITVVHGLMKTRAAMRGVLGQRFPELVKPYVNVLRVIMDGRNVPVLGALELALTDIPNEGTAQGMFCAAAVEIIEAD